VMSIITNPDGRQLKVPVFWAGGRQWRFRYASGSTGSHTYRTECSDAENQGLHGIEGKIEVVAYRGDNPLYRHGPVRVSENERHFKHADGTPFFWLGDTWWKNLCKRMTWQGFQELKVGVWFYQIGDRQEFDNFEVSPARLAPEAREVKEKTQTFIWSGEGNAPPVPSPQDWVLVLERVKH